MKKALLGLVLVSLASLIIVSCGGGGGGGGGTDITLLGLVSSMRYLWVMKNATVNFSNMAAPITGDGVTTATVTVSNETTGISETWTHQASNPGLYTGQSGNAPAPGQNVSLKVEDGNDTITGDPTMVSNPTYTWSGFFAGQAPVTVSWEVSYPGPLTYEATHTWVMITSATTGYQRIVPITTTSIQVPSAEVAPGTYDIGIMSINSMDLTGAKAGSAFYVGGSGFNTGTLIIN